jgi:hypothetical protein
MEFYSAIKNEIMLFAGKWMELENFMLNEVELGSKKKIKGCMICLMWKLDL